MPDLVEVGTGGVFRAFRRRRHACPHGACDAPFGALRPAILVAVGCVNGAVSAPIRGNWGESSRADAGAFERAQSLTAFRAFSIVRSTRKSPAGAYADKRGRSIFQTRRRLRAQMTLRGALNTRREDGELRQCVLRGGERGPPSNFRSGSAQAGLTARSGRQVNFSFKGNGIGDCRPDAACILSRQEPSQARLLGRRTGRDASPLVSLRFRTRPPQRGRTSAQSWPHGFAGAASPMSGSRFENGAAHRGGPVGRRGRLWRGLGTPGTGTPVEQNGF